MTAEVKDTIYSHLKTLDLNPTPLSTAPLLPMGWSFTLSPGILSELYLCSPTDHHTQLQLTTTIDISPHKDIDTFAVTITPTIAPLTLLNTTEELVLKLTLTTATEEIPALLSEGIILTRHTAGAAFTSALSLCNKESNVADAIKNTIALLKQARMQA